MNSISVRLKQFLASNITSSATLSVFAGWNATTGPRNIAVTAYNENVTVNTFVRVDVIACTPHLWTCATSFGLYTTDGFAGGISTIGLMVLGMNLYRQRRRNSAFPRTA